MTGPGSVKAQVLEVLTGHGPAVPLLALVLAGALVLVIATHLVRHASAIAEATGLGGLWIGSVLLAAATSLPELLTAVDAALLAAPDIGVGDLLGATVVNTLVLALANLLFASRRVLHSVAPEHVRLGFLGILLAAMAGLAIVTRGWGRIGHVGIETLAIAGAYLAVMRSLYRARAGASSRAPDGNGSEATGPRHYAGFARAAAGLVVVAPLLVLSAEALSRESGATRTFVGTFLVGLMTTLPEMAATVSAVRMGSLDLAVGNIFGSNAFNMTLLLVMDVAYLPGPVLAVASRDHLLTILVAITCLGLGIMAILSRKGRRRVVPNIESALIVIAYALGAWALYRLGK